MFQNAAPGHLLKSLWDLVKRFHPQTFQNILKYSRSRFKMHLFSLFASVKQLPWVFIIKFGSMKIRRYEWYTSWNIGESTKIFSEYKLILVWNFVYFTRSIQYFYRLPPYVYLSFLYPKNCSHTTRWGMSNSTCTVESFHDSKFNFSGQFLTKYVFWRDDFWCSSFSNHHQQNQKVLKKYTETLFFALDFELVKLFIENFIYYTVELLHERLIPLSVITRRLYCWVFFTKGL